MTKKVLQRYAGHTIRIHQFVVYSFLGLNLTKNAIAKKNTKIPVKQTTIRAPISVALNDWDTIWIPKKANQIDIQDMPNHQKRCTQVHKSALSHSTIRIKMPSTVRKNHTKDKEIVKITQLIIFMEYFFVGKEYNDFSVDFKTR